MNVIKSVLKVILSLIFIVVLFFFFGYFLIGINAENNLSRTFIPSKQNIEEIKQRPMYISEGSQSVKIFDEFNEDTIDKLGFYIRIDKIHLFKHVVKDVDPTSEEIYRSSWNFGVSHGKYTSYPDKNGITYLFAHAIGNKDEAAENNAWFSNLDQLVEGDIVYLYYQGAKYTYEIVDIYSVSPNATAIYTGASPIPMIRLQYCGPPTGSIDSRMILDGILINTEQL